MLHVNKMKKKKKKKKRRLSHVSLSGAIESNLKLSLPSRPTKD